MILALSNISIIWWVVIITGIAGVIGTGVGGVVGALLGRESKKVVSLLLGFAGGVMLSVVCFDLIDEAIEINKVSNFNLILVVGGIILGYVLIYVLNYVIDRHTNHEIEHIDDEHPKTADDLDELIHSNHYHVHRKKHEVSGNYYQLFIAGIVMACAIALHNLPEGMVIGASYAKDSGEIISGSGFIMALVIGLHNIPEGMSVSVPLIASGTKKKKAILITAASGIPTVLGALIGYFLGTLSPLWMALSISFASGAMLYVVFGELLPEAILMWKSKLPALFTLIGMIVGLILVQI